MIQLRRGNGSSIISFSYSRSQAFFGENLPQSPSFVQHYMRHPQGLTSDEESGASVDQTTTDDEDYSSDESGGHEQEAENIPPPAQEPPSEAEEVVAPVQNLQTSPTIPVRRKQRRNSHRERTRALMGMTPHPADVRHHDDASDLQSDPIPGESTPLLRHHHTVAMDTSNFFSSSPPDAVPFARQSKSLQANAQAKRKYKCLYLFNTWRSIHCGSNPVQFNKVS